MADRSSTLHERLTREKARLQIEVGQIGPGLIRNRLLDKIRQLDAASQINQWITSPGLRAPT